MPKRSPDTNALLKDALIKLGKEEFALSMGQQGRSYDAAVKDAQINLRKEEFALSMGLRRNYAAAKDAQI